MTNLCRNLRNSTGCTYFSLPWSVVHYIKSHIQCNDYRGGKELLIPNASIEFVAMNVDFAGQQALTKAQAGRINSQKIIPSQCVCMRAHVRVCVQSFFNLIFNREINRETNKSELNE